MRKAGFFTVILTVCMLLLVANVFAANPPLSLTLKPCRNRRARATYISSLQLGIMTMFYRWAILRLSLSW